MMYYIFKSFNVFNLIECRKKRYKLIKLFALAPLEGHSVVLLEINK